MMFDSIPRWFRRRTLAGLKLSDRYVTPMMPFALSPDEGLALADCIPGVRAARDVAFPPGGIWKWAAWPPLDGVGFMRPVRPSMTLTNFG